ncbi:hypothetical protein [Thermospira aquatica]|uniref:Uncharacterized protein n=1 Tax=Thermospira aquatica TaxID=2828656 RepID=A0AAX3BCH7_9SPIR|nr:hypothetical protein [Thermospira aquatica]URA09910.1 hypothetical protein KDW03_10560 [Thermospira aquatica]
MDSTGSLTWGYDLKNGELTELFMDIGIDGIKRTLNFGFASLSGKGGENFPCARCG